MGLGSVIGRLLRLPTTLSRKVDEVDRKSREMKHTLRNLAMRSNALHKLVHEMREDDVWRRGRDTQ